MKLFKDIDWKESAASKDRFNRRPVSTIVYSFIGKLLHSVGCFRVRRWLSYAPRCLTSQCSGSPRVSNTPPSGTLWLTSSTEMSITCKKSKSKRRFSGDLFSCPAVRPAPLRSAGLYVRSHRFDNTDCARMQMLPVALFGPCVFTVPMATLGSSRRAAAYCGVGVGSACVEQLNQLGQSIISMYIPFRRSVLLLRCHGRPANGPWHICPSLFVLWYTSSVLLSHIRNTLRVCVFCSLSFGRAGIIPQDDRIFQAFCLRISSRRLSSPGLTHSS